MRDHYLENQAALPASYVEHIEALNGWEGDLGDELGYVVLWDRETIQERWDAYQMAEFLGERWFPFGSDGGGEMLCFDLEAGGDAVFWLPYIGMAAEKPILRYNSFAQLSQRIRQLVQEQ